MSRSVRRAQFWARADQLPSVAVAVVFFAVGPLSLDKAVLSARSVKRAHAHSKIGNLEAPRAPLVARVHRRRLP